MRVAILKLARPEKRNALDDTTVEGIETFFSAIPDGVGAVVLAGEGEHFSAGLDLSELTERTSPKASSIRGPGIAPSSASNMAKYRSSPCCTAQSSGADWNSPPQRMCGWPSARAYYALPEGSRGIYVGGGGSVRLPPLIGLARMKAMMLTG